MGNGGDITVKKAMAALGISQFQAEQLDRLDGTTDGKISASVFNMAQSVKGNMQKGLVFSGLQNVKNKDYNQVKSIMEKNDVPIPFTSTPVDEKERRKKDINVIDRVGCYDPGILDENLKLTYDEKGNKVYSVNYEISEFDAYNKNDRSIEDYYKFDKNGQLVEYSATMIIGSEWGSYKYGKIVLKDGTCTYYDMDGKVHGRTVDMKDGKTKKYIDPNGKVLYYRENDKGIVRFYNPDQKLRYEIKPASGDAAEFDKKGNKVREFRVGLQYNGGDIGYEFNPLPEDKYDDLIGEFQRGGGIF